MTTFKYSVLKDTVTSVSDRLYPLSLPLTTSSHFKTSCFLPTLSWPPTQLIKGHHSPLLELQACEFVFRYHRSALSKRTVGAREAPHFALNTDVCFKTEWQSHNQLSYWIQNENTIWSATRDERKWGGTQTVGKQTEVKWKLREVKGGLKGEHFCCVESFWVEPAEVCFEESPQGLWVQIKGKERRGNKCVYSVCVCCLKISSETQFDTSLRLCFTWHLKQYWISRFGP